MAKKETRNKWKSYRFGNREVFNAKEAESWGVLDVLLCETNCARHLSGGDWKDLKMTLDEVDLSELAEDDEKIVESLKKKIARKKL